MGSPGEDDPGTDLLHFIALQILSTTYGLCYLAVWRSHFPSKIELWLWRASCLCQFAFFLAGLTARLVWQAIHDIQQRRHGHNEVTEDATSHISCFATLLLRCRIGDKATNYVKASLEALVAIATVITVLARLFLLTESWISLRDPPRGTYSTVHWTAYIPHIS